MTNYLKMSSKELTQNGLIDPKGNFYPCEFCGHNDLYDELKNNGLSFEGQRESELRWIKVSTGIFKDMTVFVMMGRLVTGKQKLVVEAIVTKYNLLKPNDDVNVGWGVRLCKDQDGKLFWEKDE